MFSQMRGPSSFGQYPNAGMMRQFPFASNFTQPPNLGPTAPTQGGMGGIQGLLQKFTGGVGTSQSAGAVTSTATTGSGVTGMLGNVQQLLKMAQSAGPVIQQYGPMAKNLPMMFKMLKAFNEDDESDDTAETIKSDQTEEDKNNKVEINKENINKIETDTKRKRVVDKKKEISSGISTPKLFI
ncbi:YqfQ family protein [Aquibacillus saliphilus]|uniref:YqfQ family protein n=1 Tax=Aquibacillus saliphilus TaxID=1909422 RepID=UPI001CF07D1C|nr:YqfQ family protein [Aquibacillus saliphilus]